MFSFIHPCIIELYISSVNLYILQEKINNGSSYNKKLQDDVDKAANEFIICAKKAEELFQSSALVQEQLDILSTQKIGLA
jgi:hypothetical protein